MGRRPLPSCYHTLPHKKSEPRTGHPWFSAPRGVGRRTNGCPALLLFPYSTLVVGLLIRWRLQTTVGPSEEGVTITLAGSIVARGSHHRIKKPRPAPCTCTHGNHGARASLALPDATCLPSSRDGRIEQKGHLRVLTNSTGRHTARALAASRASPLARGACIGD